LRPKAWPLIGKTVLEPARKEEGPITFVETWFFRRLADGGTADTGWVADQLRFSSSKLRLLPSLPHLGPATTVRSSGFVSAYVLPQLSISKPSLQIDGKCYFLSRRRRGN
jgi:hypothetical protein